MNTPKKDRKQTDNMELLKQQASACGPGCGCHSTGMPGKARWVIGVIVLVAAGVMVVRAMIRSDGASSQASPTAFADPVVAQSAAGTSRTEAKAEETAPVGEPSVGTIISAFAELNKVAGSTDAVFIFLPGKENGSGKAPTAPMQKAAQIMEGKGVKCGLFTLKGGSADHKSIAAQMAVPGVLAVVKGRGMVPVSGEITESKLLQGYVAASSAGGCGSSCGPAAAGCR